MKEYTVTGYFSLSKEILAEDEEQAQEKFDIIIRPILDNNKGLVFDNITIEED